jgi:Spy/CpxP family protein refolding chaperone
MRMPGQNLLNTLADGLTAGSFDVAKVDAAVAQVTAAAAGVHDTCVDALNRLHAVLTPPERAALVDKVESHWAVWQKANADATGPANRGGDHLAMLATDVALTTDQVDKIRAGLATRTTAPRLDPREVATHIRAFGDAFRSETFDARALAATSAANAHLIAWGAAHTAYFVETATPVLTPDQRVQFAQRLREHASHDPSAQGNP